MHLYPRMLRLLRQRGLLMETDRVLVVAGGEFDRQVLLEQRLVDVVITNLGYHAGQTDYAPYSWRRLDAERMDLEDGAVDWAIVHAGLHHLAVPALGVCEMFRVARKGILCLEARDSMLMKLLVRLGLTAEYELEPAFLSGGTIGGYRDGPIPNYVYRWTEREFEKVIHSFAPAHRHDFFYGYGYSVPAQRFAMARSAWMRLAGRGMAGLAKLAEWVLPTQGNQFAFGVVKNVAVQPWLTPELRFDESYMAAKYDRARYR